MTNGERFKEVFGFGADGSRVIAVNSTWWDCEYQSYKRWISVEERLPNRNGEYLVSGKDKVWVCEFIILGGAGGWCNSARNPCVKYWMPLPELPKEEPNNG